MENKENKKRKMNDGKTRINEGKEECCGRERKDKVCKGRCKKEEEEKWTERSFVFEEENKKMIALLMLMIIMIEKKERIRRKKKISWPNT